MAVDGAKHVMLSYNHKSKKVVEAVYNALKTENIPVWFDVRDMDANMYDSMAEAVNDAAIVVCFMSPEYEDSRNTKLELEHAQRLGKRIIPCMMTNRKVWKPSPSKWLGLITGSIIAIDFSDASDADVIEKTKEIIGRIRKDASALTARSSSAFEPIRQRYLQQNRMKRMVNEEKSFAIEQNYVNLAIVDSKEQHDNEKKLKRQETRTDAILGTYEEIYGMKTALDVTKIFERCKATTKKVLVLGRAGIGKSTFCQYVTYRWAKGEIWSQFDLVVLVQLRKLTESRYPPTAAYTPIDLIKKEYFPYTDLSTDGKKQIDSGNVLWILDGYDEFAQSVPNQLKDVFAYILETQHHILTSRPYAIALPYEVKLEITGFTDDNIVRYVEHFFEQLKGDMPTATSDGQKLLTFLKSNASIWGIAHIPVNLELICSLWSDTDWSQKKTLTMTTLYENITEWLCRRHLQKQEVNHISLKRRKVYELCQKELHFLETLAFKAMESNEILLPPTLLEQAEEATNCFIDDHPQLLNFGILKSYDDKPTGNQIQAQKQYYFVHLSFQEYFAARHLLRSLNGVDKQKAVAFIGSYKYNRRFLYVFLFASGLLARSEYQACIETFWKTLDEAPVDLVGVAHIKLIIGCLDELEGQTLFQQSAEYVKSVVDWLEICIRAKALVLTDHLLVSLDRTTSLCSNSMIQKKLVELLSSEDKTVQRRTYGVLSRVTIFTPLPELVAKLLDTLRDDTADLQSYACDAVAKLADKTPTKALTTALLDALRSANTYIKSCACKAFEQLGDPAASAEVISALVDALQDPDDYVRRCAGRALASISDVASNEDIVELLFRGLQYDNDSVSESACEAIAKLAESPAGKATIAPLLDALWTQDRHARICGCSVLAMMDDPTAASRTVAVLIDALQDEDTDAVTRASAVLQQIGAQAATEEVIAGLINAVQDEYWDVRRYGCIVLGTMGTVVAIPPVVAALLNAVQDEVPETRSSAIVALGKLGEKAATSGVIANLKNALADEDWDTRRCACEALGMLGGKAATEEVMAALLDLLQDEYEDARSCACKALGQMGEKAATQEVIVALVNALDDGDDNVKSCACQALGNMGEKAATEEVLDGLINALQDETPSVRNGACKALGKLGAKAATEQVLACLLVTSQDYSEEVRGSVYRALGNMGERAMTTEIIAGLINAFQDTFADVVRCAYEALGKFAAQATTAQIIVALVNACSSDDHPGSDYPFAYVLGQSFCSYRAMQQLDSGTLSKLNQCVRWNQDIRFAQVPIDLLLRLFVETEEDAWLPLVTLIALLHQVAVTADVHKITIYHLNEVLELPVSQQQRMEALVKAFRYQRANLENSRTLSS